MLRNDASIRSLRPNVSHDEALRHFTGGIRGLAANFLRGRARAIADLYIPYRLFHMEIRNRGRAESRIYALDAVAGVLDLFAFSSAPGNGEIVTVHTRNAIPNRLTVDQARTIVIEKVRRVVYSGGFARLRNLRIEAVAIESEIHLPYWMCFRGDDDLAKFEILNAIRRRPEGAKVRGLVEEWLRASRESYLQEPNATRRS